MGAILIFYCHLYNLQPSHINLREVIDLVAEGILWCCVGIYLFDIVTNHPKRYLVVGIPPNVSFIHFRELPWFAQICCIIIEKLIAICVFHELQYARNLLLDSRLVKFVTTCEGLRGIPWPKGLPAPQWKQPPQCLLLFENYIFKGKFIDMLWVLDFCRYHH